MRRSLFALTFLALALMLACDTGQPALTPASPTPVSALISSPTPVSTATPTATPTPTRAPTVTPWPTYTASPTRTATPMPTPLPRLSSWLYPTSPRERELFDQVRRAHYRFVEQVWPKYYDLPRVDFDRACDDLRKAADAYLGEFPDTMAAAAVYGMAGIIDGTRWYMAAGGFPFDEPDLYVSSQHNEDYRQAIRLYLAHSKGLGIPLAEGLKAIGLPVAWSQKADLDGDARPDTLLGLGSEAGDSPGIAGYLYVLRASGEDGNIPRQILTQYVSQENTRLGHWIEKLEVADINRDGRNEIVTQNVYTYMGGPGLYVNVFRWQGNDFANVLDWEGPDLYYGDMRMRVLSQTGAKEIIVQAGKMSPEWAFNLPKTFYYQWDGQRYTCQLPLRYSEYYDHSKENGHYYFFKKQDYAKALAEYEKTLERYKAQYGEEYEEDSADSYYFAPWCHINIIVCYKALGDEGRFQKAYAAFRQQYPDWVWTLDSQLLELKATKQGYAQGLKHAWHDGTAWHVELVPTVSGGDVGSYVSLALDEADRPHLSYLDYINNSLRYVWYDGTEWQIKKVPGDVYDWSACPSLALDGAGRPHISYNDFDLKYAWHDGTIWHVETVGGTGHGVGSPTSLALDEAGRPHISYYGYTDDFRAELKYAWRDGTAWHVETVDNSESMSFSYVALVLDRAGRPHISYHDDGQSLKYAWRDETMWHVETVPTVSPDDTNFSLALDEAGRPHISYYDHAHGDLKYAWRDETIWHVETVGSTGDVGSTSLVLDRAGRPHIAYYEHTHGDLKYAWRDGAVWHVETVDSPGIVRSNISLVLDKTGRPHISYYNGSSGGSNTP